MTGLPVLNFAPFAAMTASLCANGNTIINPAELTPKGDFWFDCMRRDTAPLMDYDMVATLLG
jgi:hypothetical protein